MTEMVVDHSVREDWAMHLPLLLHALFLGEFTLQSVIHVKLICEHMNIVDVTQSKHCGLAVMVQYDE